MMVIGDATLIAISTIFHSRIKWAKFITTFAFVILVIAKTDTLNWNHVDPTFAAKCEVTCWKRPHDQPECMRICLNEMWNKPGDCPSNASNQTLTLLEETVSQSCQSDIDCSYTAKCCQNGSGYFCINPINLDKVEGLPPTAYDVQVHTTGNDSTTESFGVSISWHSDHVGENLLFLVEERYHSGEKFSEKQSSDWIVSSQTTKKEISIDDFNKPERWFQFRIVAVNENGTKGPSLPSQPFYSFRRPQLPNAPEDMRVGAASWGRGLFHVQVLWKKPANDTSIISEYKIVWNQLHNLTFESYSETTPWNVTTFWLHNMTINTEYFIQVQAVSYIHAKKLCGKKASVVFTTSSYSFSKMLNKHPRAKRKKEDVIERHRIKHFTLQNVFWRQNELLARFSWKPVNTSEITYFLSWKTHGCPSGRKEWYIGKTEITQFEIYDLQWNCNYKVQVKTMWNKSSYVAKICFTTSNRNESHVVDQITKC